MTRMEEQFLAFAERLTGTNRDNIKILSCEADNNGLLHGAIMIDGHREYISEYHN